MPGFDAPVHRALTEPILIAGAPRAVAISSCAKRRGKMNLRHTRIATNTIRGYEPAGASQSQAQEGR
ncbi:MAG TPA: hypothetical protein VFY53_07705, partial [Rhodoplanes sp.]|nr:hypothetical protein [Rhodoplanes sp.]